MKVVILGAGIIGITTAYELLKSGFDVTIIDRQPKPAMETSYGNAGLIAPGHSYAWTTPKLPGNLIKSLIQKQRAFRFRFQWDPAMWRWGIRFVGQCTHKKMAENTLRKLRLSAYSQKLFHKITAELNIRYHQNRKGLIYIFRTADSFADGKHKLTLLKPKMNNLTLLSRNELIEIEPALENITTELTGGIYCSSDESGSSHDFTIKLAEKCQGMGAQFQFEATIEKLNFENKCVNSVVTNQGEIQGDIFVMALAAFSPLISRSIGDYLPIYPVKGYSITIPILDKSKTPIHSGIDEDNMQAFSLMGDKIRFTSVAEISGYDTSHTPSDFIKIIEQAESLFPGAFDLSQQEYWAGLRPMTPNGSPILGQGRMDNLYYNTGHGHLGWTMCAGAAKITADLIHGKKPDIDLEGMTLKTI